MKKEDKKSSYLFFLVTTLLLEVYNWINVVQVVCLSIGVTDKLHKNRRKKSYKYSNNSN